MIKWCYHCMEEVEELPQDDLECPRCGTDLEWVYQTECYRGDGCDDPNHVESLDIHLEPMEHHG